MNLIKRLRGLTEGRIVVPFATTLGLCVLTFLLADYLSSRLPKWSMWFVRIKELSLATIPALMVILVDHFVTIRRVATEVTKQIQVAMADMMELFVFGSTKAGLVAFHQRLDFPKIIDELEPGDELLWCDTYCPLSGQLTEVIERALAKGAKFRMLVIDPKSVNAAYRAAELGYQYQSEDVFVKETEVFLDRILAVANKYKHEDPVMSPCRVLVYDSLPGIPMYIIARNGIGIRGYSGFFLSKASAFFFHMEWKRTENGVLEEMHKHFETKWSAVEQKQGKHPAPPRRPERIALGQRTHPSRARNVQSIKHA